MKGTNAKIKIGDQIFDCRSIPETEIPKSDFPELDELEMLAQVETKEISFEMANEAHEYENMEYYMRRGNSLYFRNIACMMKMTTPDAQNISQYLKYGDVISFQINEAQQTPQ